eukprot:CAMPEP_0185785548 /NCGR_PEP_ID=MMETSP1174-20130828/130235_1 /TAXON_ID=35687 /ORGANISM="Dictyocha speculum, Strain CCMP1381" /LENGTH=189 /DNA_ID=CAMNT_0028477683 /DNA_START=39 /DNA_END=608 /DNA_ORIENTATION=-
MALNSGRNRCPVCRFETVLFVSDDDRAFPLCPYCFNHPRDEWGGDTQVVPNPKNMHTQLRHCPMGDGHPLVVSLSVCADERGGVFIVEPSRPGQRCCRLHATRALTTMDLSPSVKCVEPAPEGLRVSFHSHLTPLDGGKLEYAGDFLSDPLIQSLLHTREDPRALAVRGGSRMRQARAPRDPRMSFRDF